MSKRVIFIEHDHVSDGGPIWHQFKARGYEITRFIIVDKEHDDWGVVLMKTVPSKIQFKI